MSAEHLITVSDRDHTSGPADARATLLVYGDYQCPYTREANLAIRRVQPRLGSALRYVYRHFPLRSIHPFAQHAAEVAETAHAAEKFWAIHDVLFRHQQALDDDHLVRYAGEVGVDERSVWDALGTHAHAERVEDDVQSGLALEVEGTPTLFINGIRYKGKRDPSSLEAALREAVEHATAI